MKKIFLILIFLSLTLNYSFASPPLVERMMAMTKAELEETLDRMELTTGVDKPNLDGLSTEQKELTLEIFYWKVQIAENRVLAKILKNEPTISETMRNDDSFGEDSELNKFLNEQIKKEQLAKDKEIQLILSTIEHQTEFLIIAGEELKKLNAKSVVKNIEIPKGAFEIKGLGWHLDDGEILAMLEHLGYKCFTGYRTYNEASPDDIKKVGSGIKNSFQCVSQSILPEIISGTDWSQASVIENYHVSISIFKSSSLFGFPTQVIKLKCDVINACETDFKLVAQQIVDNKPISTLNVKGDGWQGIALDGSWIEVDRGRKAIFIGKKAENSFGITL